MKRLGSWDAVLLYSETPNVHMHTIKVAVIELDDASRGFGIDYFRDILGERLNRLYPFRYQLVDIPMKLHHPMWRENCRIDLRYHIRPWRVAHPGGRRELDAAVSEIASTPLDRTRPLWELYFVEGLADERVAVVVKIHHALADGVASANLIARGLDPTLGSEAELDNDITDPEPTKPQLLAYALRDHMRQIGRLPGVIGYTARGFARVRRSSLKASEVGQPVKPPATFMNHMIDSRRRFATATLALDDIKATSKHLAVTINDLVLALSAGGLREMLLQYDGKADEPLVGSIPVAFDVSPDRISGNRFGGVLVALPAHVADPIARVRAAHDGAALAKKSHQLIGPELTSRWAAYMPPAPAESLFSWLSTRDGRNKILNIPISNVPGPRERGRVGGALITEIYSVGPLTPGSGLNITVWSYVDQLNISVLSDGATLNDPHELTDAMIEDFVKIRAAAGLSGELKVVETAMQ